MAYNVVGQHDYDEHDREDDSTPKQKHMQKQKLAYAPLGPEGLFLDSTTGDRDTNSHNFFVQYSAGYGLSSIVESIASQSASNPNYGLVEADDYAKDAPNSPDLSARQSSIPLHIPRARHRSPATADGVSKVLPRSTRSPPFEPILRTASGRSTALRHPTPDLQTLQGAYVGNIEHLDKMAEKLSMTSSIDAAIKQLNDEQKRSESRRSSLLSSQGMAAITRQVSNASSIIETNSTARSGGFSPAGYMMSSGGSFSGQTTGRGRSTSKSSRFGTRPEPELEGRPLDSFVGIHSMHSSSMSPKSPGLARKVSYEVQGDETSTLTRPVAGLMESPIMEEPTPKVIDEYSRPETSASTFYSDPEAMFEGFDGIHATMSNTPASPPQQVVFAESDMDYENDHVRQRRASAGNRLTRPKSYADPMSGQNMIYYPAPVPTTLKLPPKLSKRPDSMARDTRRSQVMSMMPQATRQSTMWLPGGQEGGHDGVVHEDEVNGQEYIPQHQRASMGGRRLTQDMSKMPSQLRASAFFELPSSSEVVALKDQSAVATLDSILDASANAPVSAFTDHEYAGHLGDEVYGRANLRNSRMSTQMLDPSKKRNSSMNILLRNRRASTNEIEAVENRRSTVTGVIESAVRSPIEESEDGIKDTTPLNQSEQGEEQDEDSGSDQGQRDDEVYHGPPTTLLAELHLRKQQAKQRTKQDPLTYPNGKNSTLLERDAVLQVQAKSRKQKRTILAWEDPEAVEQVVVEDDDEDVPLAVLFSKKAAAVNRPMGLMERREMEDNEPLSQRRNRLQGRPAIPRATTMVNIPGYVPSEHEGETLAQRVQRLKEAGGTATGLPADAGLLGPAARPISGDFASEMMSQFGGDLLDKGKGKEIDPPPPEEEETMGQRRKRLQAERGARAKEVASTPQVETPPALPRPEIKSRKTMADILQAHPAAGAERAVSYEKPVGGLLGMHEKQNARRASTALQFDTSNVLAAQPGQRNVSGGHRSGFEHSQSAMNLNQMYPQMGAPVQAPQAHGFNMYQQGMPYASQPNLGVYGAGGVYGGGVGNAYGSQMMLPMPFANPYAAIGQQGMNMPMGMGMGMPMNYMQGIQLGQNGEPLNQGQLDMVERWRQSVRQ